MTIKAAGSVTVASITDVASTTRYYLLQASTLSAPAKPTAKPPGGSWSATEPTYTEGSTNSLYTCDLTTFSDGTFAYSSVSLSTSYEAAKAAYNKAVAAAAAAAATDQHFWADTDGAHVSSTGDHDTSGFHQLMTSVKNAFMHGTTDLMTISENLIELGKNSTSAIIKLCNGTGSLQVITTAISSTASAAVMTLKSAYTAVQGQYNAILRTTNGLTGSSYITAEVTTGYLDDSTTGPMYVDVKSESGSQYSDIMVSPTDIAFDSGGTYTFDGISVSADRLTTLLSDTGWTWLANYGSGDGIRWRCVAGVVYVQAAIYGEHTVGAGGWNAGTIPAAYRPSSDVAVAGVSFGALTNPTQLSARSDGNVNLWAPSDTTYFGGSLSYPLEA